MDALAVETTDIPGLLVVRIPLHHDNRGWFKENWQREKMVALGLPDFGPVQNNVSFNARRGTTRGVHSEPWEKLVSTTNGRAFGAWVDLRAGESFGTTVCVELNPGVAVFVPRGVGNSYQTLDDNVAYSYLVNEHWRAGVTYPALNLADPTVAIPWPIPLAEAEISEKDHTTPWLADVVPAAHRTPLVIGANGQLGRALMAALPHARGVDVDELDITNPDAVAAWPWGDHDVVINAAAYTAVDAAETPEGRVTAWAVNAQAPGLIARAARAHGVTMVQVSTEYVFDGTQPEHREDESLSPLGVYAQTKAAGDLAVAANPRHYVVRTSWLIGDGGNFVRTMQRLAADGVRPTVVDDQFGRLTFTTELVRAIEHLVGTEAPFGTYHVSNGGEPASWAQVARRVFELSGRAADDVTPVSTDTYYAGKSLAPRPQHSAFDLSKIRGTGFEPDDQWVALERYVSD